jgi:hypothetical protein
MKNLKKTILTINVVLPIHNKMPRIKYKDNYLKGANRMVNWLNFLMLIFASFRLTRLIVYDTLTEFLRRPFHNTVEEVLPDGKTESYIEIKGTGIRYWIGELLSCHWCTGFWSTVIVYSSYLLWPRYAIPVITILAIAGCASIIQTSLEKD